VPQVRFSAGADSGGPLNQVSLATKLKTVDDAAAEPAGLFAHLSSFKPDAVFGVGGYASGPAMVTAILRRFPTMVFEPNAVPGMANRLIGKRVKRGGCELSTCREVVSQC
jgi:UDP-N-acetylglucosamine--N-acetylmuramyl-(pentapeptide) pyrophosphoryl-undecaprenol N-acetylglucosamine transferase